MKELKEFTVERLEEIEVDAYEANPTKEEMRALAKIALAAKQAEVVAYITYKGHLLHAADPKVVEHSDPEPLYDAPPLNHTDHHLDMVVPDGFTEIQLIKAMTWINRVRAENPNMKEARTCADLILRVLPAAPKPEM